MSQFNKLFFILFIFNSNTISLCMNNAVEPFNEALADINNQDGHCRLTRLHHAVMDNNLHHTKLLLEHKADVHLQNYMGRTALHMASIYKYVSDHAKLLLEYKAAVNACDNKNKTPLYYSVKANNIEVTKTLLINGAFVDDEMFKANTNNLKEILLYPLAYNNYDILNNKKIKKLIKSAYLQQGSTP